MRLRTHAVHSALGSTQAHTYAVRSALGSIRAYTNALHSSLGSIRSYTNALHSALGSKRRSLPSLLPQLPWLAQVLALETEARVMWIWLQPMLLLQPWKPTKGL